MQDAHETHDMPRCVAYEWWDAHRMHDTHQEHCCDPELPNTALNLIRTNGRSAKSLILQIARKGQTLRILRIAERQNHCFAKRCVKPETETLTLAQTPQSSTQIQTIESMTPRLLETSRQ